MPSAPAEGASKPAAAPRALRRIRVQGWDPQTGLCRHFIPDQPGGMHTATGLAHDPCELHAARRLAEEIGPIRLGVFFRDLSRPKYEETFTLPVRTARERIDLLNEELDCHAV